jgi:hypothetical protein
MGEQSRVSLLLFAIFAFPVSPLFPVPCLPHSCVSKLWVNSFSLAQDFVIFSPE